MFNTLLSECKQTVTSNSAIYLLPVAFFMLIAAFWVQQLSHIDGLTILAIIGLLPFAYATCRPYGVVFLLCLFWALSFSYWQLQQRLPERLDGQVLQIDGIVSSVPQYHERDIQFDFTVLIPETLPSRIQLHLYDTQQILKAGQHWRLSVKLKRPHGSVNPFGFDYERYLLELGVGATGTVKAMPKPILLGIDNSIVFYIVRWRQTVSDLLDRVPISANALALIKALSLGDDHLMRREQWDVLRKTGTTHLWVISGSHISLVAGLVYSVVRQLWIRVPCLLWPPHQVAAIFAMLSAIVYSALAGLSIPVQRSLIMVITALCALIWQRHTSPLNVLALALLLVLLFDPLAVLSIGCILSFASVALIMYAVSGRLQQGSLVSVTLKVNWFTFIGLAPCLLYNFSQLALLSPLANMIAVPIASIFIVPPALFALVLLFVFPDGANWLLQAVAYVLEYLWYVLSYFAQLSCVWIRPQPSIAVLLLSIVGVLVLLAPRGFPGKIAALVMLIPLLFSSNKAPSMGKLNVTVLDVGQGLAVVIQTAQHWYVYDTGNRFSADNDSGLSVILPFLYAHGVKQLDGLIVSHGDSDHSGGAQSILKALPTKQILTSRPDLFASNTATFCQAGHFWQVDGVDFSILSPFDHQLPGDNNHSCVLQIHSRTGSFLLTGDIEMPAEVNLVSRYGNTLQSDILIAPHHGSKTSSSDLLLRAVHPRHILISSGYHNAFHHPSAVVVARYHQWHIPWLNTANSGAISIDENLHIKTLRQTDKRYWRS